MTWHVGRQVPRNIHDGEGSDAEILVAVGPRDEAWAVARQVVEAMNERDVLLATIARQTAALEAICAATGHLVPEIGAEVWAIADAALTEGPDR